jgi:hypothetical protein
MSALEGHIKEQAAATTAANMQQATLYMEICACLIESA